MSQTVITKSFVEWKAKQALDNQPVVLDEFIFAYLPDLDANTPINNTEGIPSDKIVYRQAVSKAGIVNLNAVVYSVTVGAEVGDFDFNWIGLLNKTSNTLAAIVHAPTQRKVKNANGQQGNVLTRSVLMEYSGAQAATQITVPAETWQIDFTARLSGIDEAHRLANLDIYGRGAFFGSGFLVAKTGSQYVVTHGLGYVGGLRADLAATKNITVTTKPTKVWVDVCYHGTVTSAYQTAIKITLAASLADYNENGIAHYVFAVASIDTDGNITDLRPKGALLEQQGNSDYLRKDKNLADLTNGAAARTSLGLKGGALLDVGKLAGTLAAGDDSRIVNAVSKTGDTVTGEITSKYASNWRINYGDYGAFLHNNGVAYYLLFTDAKNQSGSQNDLRPFTADFKTGKVTFGHGITVAGRTETTGDISIRTDSRIHLTYQNVDGSYRMHLYKDKGGDGVRLNNGSDNSGDWVFHKNGNFYAPGALLAGTGVYQTDGNINGTVWGGYISNWLGIQFAARDNNINTRATWDWATQNFTARDNNIATRATWDWVTQNFIQNVRYTAEKQVGATGVNSYHENTVLTGFNNYDWDFSAEQLFWSYIQIFKNGQWLTIGR